MLRHFLKIPYQTYRRKPLQKVVRNVNLPPEKALARRYLVIMMVIMPPFAQRQQGQPQAVAAFIVRLIPLGAELVHDRVDRKRGVVQDHRAQEKPDEQRR